MERDALFKKFPYLKTERCDLQEVSLDCADDLFRIRSNPLGAHYISSAWDDPLKAENRIREWHKWFLDKEDITWGIFLHGNTRLIGYIKYAYRRQYLGMIGYHLDVEYWNKGIMTEVLKGVVRFLYDRTDAHRLQATVHCNHKSTGQVLRKLGFKKEGLLRGRAFWHGRFCDLYMYSLLRGEQMV